MKPYQKNDIEIADNFSLEGKFKLSMPDSKETGYFFLKKTKNKIQLNIGKTYLLPEEKLLLDIKEDIDLRKLFPTNYKDKSYLDFNKINIGDFIRIIMGYEIDLSSYKGLEILRDFNETDKILPKKVVLITGNYELIIMNKKIYE